MNENLATLLQHRGSEHRIGTGLVGARENSVTFSTKNVDDAPVYSRLGNTQNHAEVETLLAALHGGEDAIVTGSGMSAFNLLFLAYLRPGDHVLMLNCCYGGTFQMAKKILEPWGVSVTFAPLSSWEQHISKNTKMLLLESIVNPLCIPQDLKLAASLGRKHGILTVCDNTFASPMLCRPLDLGFDVVLESATKYLNGHSDVIAGMVAGSKKSVGVMRGIHPYIGTFLPPAQCCELLRGVRTLELRMQRHCENGSRFADAMRESKHVAHVSYGPSDDSQAAKDSISLVFPRGFGGMVSVSFANGVDVPKLLDSLKLVANLPSLGGTESTATMPLYTASSYLSTEEKRVLGIDGQLVRFSIGIENVDDVINDVLSAAR